MGNYQTEFKRLNRAQREAVETIEGPLLVVAGPGTGKTQLLSMRAANVLQKTDAAPANILCLTFTEAAARNMRERLVSLIGETAYHVGIYTFHSFGTEIIQRYPEYFIEQPLLKSVDELSAYELLRDIFSKLPHSNPLHVKVGDDFLHLASTNNVISWLKQAGVLPEDLAQLTKANQAFIEQTEPLVETIFTERPSPKLLSQYQHLLEVAQATEPGSLQALFIAELAQAISQTDPDGRYAKPITEWRNKWLVQNRLKVWVLADRRRTKFLQALINVYKDYQTALQNRGWYTFDDMILRTSKALADHEELRLTLQEQYQYIMVDEYQDTNGSQNKLLELLADNPVHEGRPNLMVVGDDDQAIYRFQGAQLSIMLDFITRWRNVKQVVLTENYRSGDALLGLARQVIVQGEDRLEASVSNVTKVLTSGLTPTPQATIHYTQAASELDQYASVAKSIAKLIKDGQPASQIAVLAPKHSYLQALVPYLIDAKLPVSYERREHILKQPRILELINLAKLVQAANAGRWDQVDTCLPVVLASEYWQIEPLELWQISVEAYRTKKLWLEIIQDHKNPQLRNFARTLPVVAQKSTNQPLETLLDQLLGNQAIKLDNDTAWHIPYRQFYFSDQQLSQHPEEYFALLGQLTSLRERLREYRPGTPLTLASFIEFIELYEQSGLPLLDTNPHATTTESVELMTAYKAKGLEWQTVFMLACHNDVWGTKTRAGSGSFALPSNLAWIKPARDSNDDRLRLFYVAMTRAKQNLFLTSYSQSLSGKATEPVSWLTAETVTLPPATVLPEPSPTELIHSQEIQWQLTPAQRTTLHDNLKPFLTNTYKLSATHLNSFVDLSQGGPKHFFFRHLLHFPEAITASSVYGSVIHQALHFMHATLTRTDSLPALSKVQASVKAGLLASSLSSEDKDRLIERGYQAIEYFYKQEGGSLQASDRSEYNFSNEGVVLNEARLTGKLDVLRQVNNELTIIDYKTGTPLDNWQAKTPYGKIRSHLYQQQLGFYCILVGNSANFGKYPVKQTMLQFVEPNDDGELLKLAYSASSQELERLQKLIQIVWKHIMDLNFPDTSSYSLDIKGVKQFEQDLIDGKI